VDPFSNTSPYFLVQFAAGFNPTVVCVGNPFRDAQTQAYSTGFF